MVPDSPDKQGPLKNDGGDEGSSSIAWQNGPEEEDSCQIVVVGQLVVVAHPPVQRHDDQRQGQLIDNTRSEKGDVSEILCGTPLHKKAPLQRTGHVLGYRCIRQQTCP